MPRLIANSLPRYFRHSNISSFIRQLNLYGFKKLTGEDVEENTYFHPRFKKNYITQLKPLRSFYNQEKYGKLRDPSAPQLESNDPPSGSQRQQPEFFQRTSVCPNQNSTNQLKQRIAILEWENERLRAVEKAHINLLSLLNQGQKPLVFQEQQAQFQNNNSQYILPSQKENSIIYTQPVRNIYSYCPNPVQNLSQVLSFYPNGYYLPLQNF